MFHMAEMNIWSRNVLGELSYQLPETAQTLELYCVLVSVVQTLPPWLMEVTGLPGLCRAGKEWAKC